MSAVFETFASRDDLVASKAFAVSEALSAAIASRGSASFAVSGGSTPRPLYEALQHAPIAWGDVTVTLVDERWVDPGEAGSNETFVRDALLHGAAAEAAFVPLKTPGAFPGVGPMAPPPGYDAIAAPFDVVVLGLGEDGHTASWFPQADGLDAALNGSDPVVGVRAHMSEVTGPFLDRVTLSRAALADAGMTLMMITGENKKIAYEAVCANGDVAERPARAVLRPAMPGLTVCWAA